MRSYALVGYGLALVACGGGSKRPPKKPIVEAPPVVEKQETEEDRAAKRLAEAQKIVPDGSSCLPTALKEPNAPRLELAASGQDALLCAIDSDPERLLGPVGCWKIDLATGGLSYKTPAPLPARGFEVKLNKGCAWGYCLPGGSKGESNTAHIAWDIDGSKVAVLAGDEVHLFDAASKSHESSFSIRGDKGVTGTPTSLAFVGPAVVIEAKGDGPETQAYVFKSDGTAQGPVMALGGKDEKPLTTYKGSISILDKNRVGFSEHGMETVTVYEIDTGKRTKLVRAAKKPACKPAELDAYWKDGDKVGDKCKASIEGLSGHLVGATAVAGAKNFLVLLRGSRLGELGVLDSKTLAEKKAIKMEWCGGGDSAKGDEKKADQKEEKAESSGTRAPKKKGDSSDPEEGGE